MQQGYHDRPRDKNVDAAAICFGMLMAIVAGGIVANVLGWF